jgi:hypothetical protein
VYPGSRLPLCVPMRDLDGGMRDRPARSPDGDVRLLRALHDALAAAEPMPLHLTDGLRGAYALRDLPLLPAATQRLRTAATRRRRGR